jgi:hypothetical protein
MPTADSVVRSHAFATLESTDRRIHDRAPLSGPVLVDALCTWHRARCENVSPGGVAIACEGTLPVGKTVEIYFELPSGLAIEARARVVRSTGANAALCFVDLDARSEVALRAHCHMANVVR